MLVGCGGNGGTVSSDIPGVAAAMISIHQRAVTPRCPVVSDQSGVTAEATSTTTEVGLQRETFSYQINC